MQSTWTTFVPIIVLTKIFFPFMQSAKTFSAQLSKKMKKPKLEEVGRLKKSPPNDSNFQHKSMQSMSGSAKSSEVSPSASHPNIYVQPLSKKPQRDSSSKLELRDFEKREKPRGSIDQWDTYRFKNRGNHILGSKMY